MKILNKLFKSDSKFKKIIEAVNAIEPELQEITSDGLLEESKKLKERVRGGESLDVLLPRAFALVRETAKRTLEQRHYDVQLMGGIVLHEGKIAEMRTGEGKTLAATLPIYLNALVGKGVHSVTVNEYLAKRDAIWMGQIYTALGLSVSCLVHDGAYMYDQNYTEGSDADTARDTTGSFLVHEEFLRPVTRKEAYRADITYGTNHEFGFDYLRDNLAQNKDAQAQRKQPYAIIDEVDSILIDEARTPLIIAAPDTESSEHYKTFARVVRGLEKETHYLVDEKMKSVDIIEEGIDKVEQAINIKNIYSAEHLRLTHYLQESLKAKELFIKDRDYVVKDGEIVIVDQFTGRMMQGRRYSGGLHQAIEAKEGITIQQESRTYASVSIQNYFRLYEKLSGMTGTAETSAEEFDKVYGLEVVSVPTHRPMIREDKPDVVYKTMEAKYDAIIKEVSECREKGQPVLIGTVSIEKNEALSRHLQKAGIPHEALNAKNNEREGGIIAQAGKPQGITVATNMAGRGVDIILGGNPATEEDADRVRQAGGLHVIGTERHESRRIDNQLRGRSGRQGDKGSTQFFLSLEDDLMRVFGGERIQGLMETLKVPNDMPIQAKMVSRAISQAQTKVEGMHFDSRKHLLEYDDVLNKQRLAIYKKRQELLEQKAPGPVLSGIDMFWMQHLENMEGLQEAVRLRAYGQHDPLVEYRREGKIMFDQLLVDYDKWLEDNKEKIEHIKNNPAMQAVPHHHHTEPVKKMTTKDGKKVGRNDPCPCGSGKKYKKCGLINAPEHKQ